MNEHAVLFGESKSLVGILTDPIALTKTKGLPAFIILNSGLVHHVGVNRLSVRIARRLAELGFAGFRIDFSGVGDSPVGNQNMPVVERWVQDCRAAMDWLTEERGIDRFVLLGNCSGAGISFLTARSDPRVVGSVLINLQGQKTPLKYFIKLALFNPKAWLRLFRGSAKIADLSKALKSYKPFSGARKSRDLYGLNEILADFRALISRKMDLLFVFSEWDPGLTYFNAHLKNEIFKLKPNGILQAEVIPGIDHDFNLLRGQEDLIRIVCNWASQIVPES